MADRREDVAAGDGDRVNVDHVAIRVARIVADPHGMSAGGNTCVDRPAEVKIVPAGLVRRRRIRGSAIQIHDLPDPVDGQAEGPTAWAGRKGEIDCDPGELELHVTVCLPAADIPTEGPTCGAAVVDAVP